MDFDPTHPRATPASDDVEATFRRQSPLVGRVIGGRYRLDSLLAAGGMGEVYRATHVELGRPLALKLMRPELSGDAGFVDRFRREAMTASRLGHPHIVDIIDSGRSDEGQFYFVMEFLDGKTLSQVMAQGPVPLPVALELVTQTAEALDVAHRAGVVHRDLKPDNVLVLERAGKPFVKLVDFGIAKVVTPAPDQKQTTHGVIMGTPQYMAPEQAAGVALDARADVYALGLILFEVLTGRPPLTGETAALVMSAHISQRAPPLPPRFPASLSALVAKMLAKRPGERPQTMAEVSSALASAPRTLAKSKPSTALVVTAVGVLLGGLGVGVMALREAPAVSAQASRQPEPPQARPPDALDVIAPVGGAPGVAPAGGTPAVTPAGAVPVAAPSEAPVIAAPVAAPPDAGPTAPRFPVAPRGPSEPRAPWLPPDA
ncbi:MAG: protein kinase [Myxococcus sp.]|nr:protein kinase [Myxococcus sp.]